jgi:hypothetical protein
VLLPYLQSYLVGFDIGYTNETANWRNKCFFVQHKLINFFRLSYSFMENCNGIFRNCFCSNVYSSAVSFLLFFCHKFINVNLVDFTFDEQTHTIEVSLNFRTNGSWHSKVAFCSLERQCFDNLEFVFVFALGRLSEETFYLRQCNLDKMSTFEDVGKFLNSK